MQKSKTHIRNAKILSIFILAVLFLPFIAQALPFVPCGTEDTPCKICHFFTLIKNVITFAAQVAIPLAVLFMGYGGILIIIGGGSEEKRRKGRTVINNTLIGLGLVFGAWLIIDFILGNLLKEGFYFWWNDFPSCE